MTNQGPRKAVDAVHSSARLHVARVESGTVVVAEAGTTMRDIVANAQNLKTLMSDISNASSAQTSDLNHVEGAIRNLDDSTQQNAALVEQTAAAAATLKDNATRLRLEMAYFRLPGADAPGGSSTAPDCSGALLARVTPGGPPPAS